MRFCVYLGELAGTERTVCSFTAQCADALLQRKQALVDLGSLHAAKRPRVMSGEKQTLINQSMRSRGINTYRR